MIGQLVSVLFIDQLVSILDQLGNIRLRFLWGCVL